VFRTSVRWGVPKLWWVMNSSISTRLRSTVVKSCLVSWVSLLGVVVREGDAVGVDDVSKTSTPVGGGPRWLGSGDSVICKNNEGVCVKRLGSSMEWCPV